jgi:iron complex outermembrane receptor protein
MNHRFSTMGAPALALLCGSALAQTAGIVGNPGNSETAPPASAESGLQEIVVTAQRREETLQKAALPVSAVSGETLRDAGVFKPTDLTSVVPALQVSTAAGPYNLFYLRGVGNFNGNALSDAAIAFNVDGVYLGRPSSTTGFFYDLRRVEVVKGPQGTLYGRNATGGAINVITQPAKLNSLEGYVTADGGNNAEVRVDGAINVPLGPIAALRAAVIYAKHNGYMTDGTDDEKEGGGRLSLSVVPSDDLRIDVVGDFFRQGGNGPGATPLLLGVNNRFGITSPQGQAFYASEPNTLMGRDFYPIAVNSFQRNNYWGISSTIDWTTPFGNLTVIPAHRDGQIDYQNLAAGFFIRQKEHDKQNSVETRFATPDNEPLRAIVGLYYFKEDIDDPLIAYNHQSNGSYQSLTTGTTSKAAFGRLTYAIIPSVRVSAGGRYTKETKDFAGMLAAPSRICVFPACPNAAPFPYDVFSPAAPDFNPLPDGTLTVPSFLDNTGANAKHASFSRATYRGAVDWDITDQNLLYASYETGFKAGGFFFSTDSGVYRPEKIAAWTLGSKNRFLDNRLQVNVEAFYWRYSDQQISHLGFDSAGIAIFPTENVGKSTMKGVEVDGEYLLFAETLLSADAQYLNARYDNFVYSKPNFNGGLNNGTGCPNLGTPGQFYTVNCSGERPPNAPLWTLNLAAQQTLPLANGGKLVGNLRTHFQTDTLTGLEFTSVEIQRAYWNVDASLTYGAPGDRYFVTGFVNNAFDKTVIGETFPPPFSLFTVATLRPPRTYGLRVGFHF